MAKRHRHVPAYRRHKPSGQARVTVNREHIYLGKYGIPESLEMYHCIVADLASLNSKPVNPASLSPNGFDFSVGELILTFWNFANCHYIKDGRPTDELNGLRIALRPVRRLYGHTAARDFGPKALKTVRQSMIDTDHSRKYINDSVNRIRRMFKWAASEEILPVSVYQALQTVSGLKAGRSAAREPELIKPVEEAVVKTTLPHVLAQVAAMIQVQYLTGARPCEVCILRATTSRSRTTACGYTARRPTRRNTWAARGGSSWAPRPRKSFGRGLIVPERRTRPWLTNDGAGRWPSCGLVALSQNTVFFRRVRRTSEWLMR